MVRKLSLAVVLAALVAWLVWLALRDAPTAASVVVVQKQVSVHVAPGDYTVRLVLPGEPPQEQRCTVTAGEMTSARLPAK
jgi:hypothetical protein